LREDIKPWDNDAVAWYIRSHEPNVLELGSVLSVGLRNVGWRGGAAHYPLGFQRGDHRRPTRRCSVAER